MKLHILVVLICDTLRVQQQLSDHLATVTLQNWQKAASVINLHLLHFSSIIKTWQSKNIIYLFKIRKHIYTSGGKLYIQFISYGHLAQPLRFTGVW